MYVCVVYVRAYYVSMRAGDEPMCVLWCLLSRAECVRVHVAYLGMCVCVYTCVWVCVLCMVYVCA